jgi:hypothetical protein
MRNDFCAFILTHQRPEEVITYRTLRASGYTGAIRLVVDDEDPRLQDYKQRYGDEVLVFNKAGQDDKLDPGDNFPKRNSVLWARSVIHELAQQNGFNFFIELDDDYHGWYHRYRGSMEYESHRMRRLDEVFECMIEFLQVSNAITVCMAQGGDYIGGKKPRVGLTRKAMNTFVCDARKPFSFFGRGNDDVSMYCLNSLRGLLTFTIMRIMISQSTTQKAAGGLTDFYREVGTYIKSFYSVMFVPSAVRISTLTGNRLNADSQPRIHHAINWNAVAPKILKETVRRRA